MGIRHEYYWNITRVLRSFHFRQIINIIIFWKCNYNHVDLGFYITYTEMRWWACSTGVKKFKWCSILFCVKMIQFQKKSLPVVDIVYYVVICQTFMRVTKRYVSISMIDGHWNSKNVPITWRAYYFEL